MLSSFIVHVFFDQSLTIKDRNFLKHQNCPSKNEKNDFYEQQQLAFVTCILNKLEIFFKVFLIWKSCSPTTHSSFRRFHRSSLYCCTRIGHIDILKVLEIIDFIIVQTKCLISTYNNCNFYNILRFSLRVLNIYIYTPIVPLLQHSIELNI